MSRFDFSAVAMKVSQFCQVAPFYHRQRETLPIVKQVGRDPGLVWKGMENLASIGIWSPVRPARSESVGYLGPLCIVILRKKTNPRQISVLNLIWYFLFNEYCHFPHNYDTVLNIFFTARRNSLAFVDECLYHAYYNFLQLCQHILHTTHLFLLVTFLWTLRHCLCSLA
jgi:hypothetical protein